MAQGEELARQPGHLEDRWADGAALCKGAKLG